MTNNDTHEEGPPLISSLSLESVRHLGLTTTDSVLELVDNSLDAGAENVYIHIVQKGEQTSIIIEDDGNGIPQNKVAEVLAFGGRVDQGGKVPIGRFGWGLPSAACCQTPRTELYSHTDGQPWYHSWIDLPTLSKAGTARLPKERQQEPPKELPLELRGAKSGTVVHLVDCDRLEWRDVKKLRSSLTQTLGETYRKYLNAGKQIYVGGKPIAPIDPLTLMQGYWGHQEAGYGTDFQTIPSIVFEDIIDPTTGKPAEIEIKIALLNWAHINYVNGDEKGQLKPKAERIRLKEKLGIGIDDQGFYLMRHDRQIGRALSLWLYKKHNDFNYFRGEISFPAVLDSYFGVQTNKNRFSLDRSVRDQIDERLKGVFAQLRKISKDWQAKEDKETETHEVRKSEEIAAKGEQLLKRSRRPVSPTEAEEVRKELEAKKQEEIKKVESTPGLTPKQKEIEIKKIENKFQFVRPFTRAIEFSESSDFYVLRPKGDQTTVVINTAHPFYKKVYEKAVESGLDNQLDLLLFMLAKAEFMAYENEHFVKFYQHQKKEWSTILSVYLDEYEDEEPEN